MSRAPAQLLALVFASCVGGAPRRATPPPHATVSAHDTDGTDALATSRDPDRFDLDSALPRSGDPARPNVKVELSVVEVSDSRALHVRAAATGSIVRGVVDVKAAVRLSGGRVRARSRTSTFVVVQAGHAGAVALSDDARRICGPYAGLRVHVLGATPSSVELEIAPYVAPTTVEGEMVQGATRVRVTGEEAVLLSGHGAERDRSSRGVGHASDESERRELVVLLTVRVIG